MKIDITKFRLGIPSQGPELIKWHLFQDLYSEVYGQKYKMLWTPVGIQKVGGSFALRPPEVHLVDMCASLRQQDWCAYYWREGVDTEDAFRPVNYKKSKGIIIGAYCSRLAAWKLAHL